MNLVTYDGSFEGLLTAFFEVYEYKIADPFICKEGIAGGSLFGSVHQANSKADKSERVYQRLKEKLSANALQQLYNVFLSEFKDFENVLFRYVQYVLSNNHSVERDYGHADVLLMQQISRKVYREKHRMEAFVRFQCTKDQLYYSIVQPDYNVLPLISKHFQTRYADQRWLIYDGLRKYGLYYNLQHTEEVKIDFNIDCNHEETQHNIFDQKEELYQSLWRQYFRSVNIKARKNMKLHIRHMPTRYWKYLVEKR